MGKDKIQSMELDSSLTTQQSVRKDNKSTEKSKPYRILERVQNALSSFRDILLSNSMGQESHFFITGQLHASARSENTPNLKEASKLSFPSTRSSNISSSFNPETTNRKEDPEIPDQKKTPVLDTSDSALSSENLAGQLPITVCSQSNPVGTPVRKEDIEICAFTQSAITSEHCCPPENTDKDLSRKEEETTPLKTQAIQIDEARKSPSPVLVQDTAKKNQELRRAKKKKRTLKDLFETKQQKPLMQHAKSSLNFPSLKPWDGIKTLIAGPTKTLQPQVQEHRAATKSTGSQIGENQTKSEKAPGSATREWIPEIAEIDPRTERMGEIVKEAKNDPPLERLLELVREFQELDKPNPFD